ncbi:MAG TPA: potassium channel family protein [Baekduia sp.]|nr:potassium channel family protein [Baekduia sp.]
MRYLGAAHRYGQVLCGSILVLGAMIMVPSTDGGAVVVLTLQAALLVLALAVAVMPRSRTMSWIVVCAALVAAVLVIADGVPRWPAAALGAIFVLIAALVLIRASVDLLRKSGVGRQIVFAALALYVLLGVMFANTVGVVAGVDADHFFAQGTDGSVADRVYFSFTALTTTGFGDLTPATSLGRAMTVVAVLIGQMYLVTVVGLLVGSLRQAGQAPAR